MPSRTPRALALLALAALASGCDGQKKPGSADVPPAVGVAQAVAVAASPPVLATGSLRRDRESQLSFRVPGEIAVLLAETGDHVRSGQVLAQINPTAYAARLAAARATLAQARRDRDRLAPLVGRGSASRQQFEDQDMAVAVDQAAVDAAEYDLRSASLRAPADGVILTRTAQRGEVVGAGQPVLSFADAGSPLLLRLPLADRDAAAVRLGARAAVTLAAMPGVQLAGTVSRIGGQSSPGTGTVSVDVRLPDQPSLLSGMIARAEIARLPDPRLPQLARVPAEALLEGSGQNAAVFVLDRKLATAHRVAVRFAGFDGDAALLGGIRPGQEVITTGGAYVSDGQVVQVADGNASAAADGDAVVLEGGK